MNKIKRGYFSFSLVTKPGEHQNYNQWHMFDHLPEQMTVDGIAFGQRWVCPPEYAKLRLANDPALAANQYVTLYLFEEPIDAALKEFATLRERLEEVGRFHRHRKAAMSGAFLAVKGYTAPRVLVSPECLPWRPNTGIFVTVDDIAAPERDRIGTWFDQVHLPDMQTVKHVAGSWYYRAVQSVRPSADTPAPSSNQAICVHYLDGDPLEMLDDLKTKIKAWKAAGRYPDDAARKPLLASLYQTIDPASKFDWFD